MAMETALARPYDVAAIPACRGDAPGGARRWWIPALCALLFAASIAVPAGVGVLRVATTITLPSAAPLDTLPLYVDSAQLPLTVAGGIAPWRATRSEIVSNVYLWRRMHLADWDAVSQPLRDEALTALVERYRDELLEPAVWDRMSADDWDRVPQPVRIFAFRRMIAYWSGYYDVGEEYGIEPWRASSTLAAIAMQESWFDHRAVTVNRYGNRDVGLAQASDFARARMRQLFERGVVDVQMTEADYLDPWKASRFLALWMKVLLAESGGDLDLATRAYHRGTARAGDELGTNYLALVQQRLHRYIMARNAPPAWTTMAAEIARLEKHYGPA